MSAVQSTKTREQRVDDPELVPAPRNFVGVDWTGKNRVTRQIACVVTAGRFDERYKLRGDRKLPDLGVDRDRQAANSGRTATPIGLVSLRDDRTSSWPPRVPATTSLPAS